MRVRLRSGRNPVRNHAAARLLERGHACGSSRLNALTEAIIGSAIEIHRTLGPGLLESAYHPCLAYELSTRRLTFEIGKTLPLAYKEVRLDCGYRLDFVVESLVVIELKSVTALAPVHTAQLLTYLKLTGCPAGLLINFNVPVLKQGIRRVLAGPRESGIDQ